MKKTLIVLLLSMVVFALVSCGEKNAPVPEEKTDVTSAVTGTDETVSSSVSVTEAATTENEIIINEDGSIELPEIFF